MLEPTILKVEKFENSTYLELLVNNKSVNFYISRRSNNELLYFNIKINNSIQKAFGSLGVDFKNFDDAINHYKNKALKETISYIKSNY